MQKRSLGQDGTTVSAIGLGCMGMSEFYGPADDAESLRTLATAAERGIDFFDTADVYGAGHNEELLGKFLRDRRGQVAVATKFGIVRKPGVYERTIDNSPAYIRQACEASLRRLNTDTIDLYYMHRRNPAIPIEDTVAAMAELVSAGKVRQLGLSEVSPETLRRAVAVHPIAAVQCEYSLWSRWREQQMIGLCRTLGVTFVAYSPLGRAFLTGTVTSTNSLASNDFRKANPRFQDDAMARNRELIGKLHAFATERQATAAQIALAWTLCKHEHLIPIPGTKRPQYLHENADAVKIRLTPGETALLDDIFKPGSIAGERYTAEGMKGIEE